MPQENDISAEYPLEPNYVEVLSSKMHYIEQGSGSPILFLHGQPTSSYLWRNIIPHVSPHGRCIAPDLIGMGRSDKPDLAYKFSDHARYLDAFIDALDLQDVTLVIHDWGSGLGFHWANRHRDRVRGIAFFEAMVRPLTWETMPADFRLPFRLMRTPGIGWLMIVVGNLFLKQFLPQGTVRKLTKEERAFYEAPYPSFKNRKPVRQWPTQVPIDGKPALTHDVISEYSDWLQESPIPKLMFTADSGTIARQELVEWCQANLSNLESVHLGEGLHFLQEDHPDAIGENVARWLQETVRAS